LYTNLKFITIRKFANLEWEVFQDKKDNKFIALCHKTSQSVQSSDWNDLWDEIIKTSKNWFKTKKKE